MSTKAEKGDRKREIEQSPMKKKFRDSAISSEDLDNAIANRIELAFKEHQSTLNSVVNSAVRDAMDSVLIPALRELREDIQATNKSVKELREEFEAIVTKAGRARGRVGSVRAAARGDGRAVADLGGSAGAARRGGGGCGGPVRAGAALDWWGFRGGWGVRVRLVFSGLVFPGGFLPWGAVALGLVGRVACVAGGGAPVGRALSSSVCWGGMADRVSWGVLVGRVRWGAHRTMSHCCFFLALVRLRRSGGGAFGPVLGRVAALGLRPFLVCPAVVGLRRGGGGGASIPLGGRGILSVPCLGGGRVPRLCGGAAGERRPLFLQFGGRGVTAGMDLALAAQKGMIAG